MIHGLVNGMITMMMAKFMLNDVPHAAGVYSTPEQFGGNPLRPEEIDPAVRDLVVALNAAGYTTEGSCEGHLPITGRVTNAYIKFVPGAVKTPEDRQHVRDIVTSYTSTPIMWLRLDEIRFRGSLREKPTASVGDAPSLLADLERGGGGPGRSVEKILSVYDIGDLRIMAGLQPAEYRTRNSTISQSKVMYHATPWSTWVKVVSKEGLRPMPLTRLIEGSPDVGVYLGSTKESTVHFVKAIWYIPYEIAPTEEEAEDLVWSYEDFALLRVQVTAGTELTPDPDYTLKDGSPGAYIVHVPIPRERITLVGRLVPSVKAAKRFRDEPAV